MTGICGSLSNKVKNGHIVVALNAIQHDVTAAGSGEDVFNLYNGRTAPIETTKSLVRRIKNTILRSDSFRDIFIWRSTYP